tara:strand:- start:4 stop:846 length:843 start_codon:yes stop_codon:yes gene_type:complete
MPPWSQGVAESIVQFANWGVTVVIILLIWTVLQAAGLVGKKTGATKRLTDMEKSPVMTWLKANKKGKKRWMSKLMNEYTAQQKEEEKLELAEDELDALLDTLRDVHGGKEFKDHNQVVLLRKHAENFKGQLRSAKNYFRRLRKDTWRQNSSFGKILDKLKENEVDTSEIEALERDILKLHKEAADEVSSAESSYSKDFMGSNHWKRVGKLNRKDHFADKSTGQPYVLPAAPGSTTPVAEGTIKALLDEAEKDVYKLKDAWKKVGEAKQHVQGIIAKTKDW